MAKRKSTPKLGRSNMTWPSEYGGSQLFGEPLGPITDDEKNAMRMVFSWWHNRGQWPKRENVGRTRKELVPPERFEAALSGLHKRELVEAMSGTGRIVQLSGILYGNALFR
jgi:hypothetical protein